MQNVAGDHSVGAHPRRGQDVPAGSVLVSCVWHPIHMPFAMHQSASTAALAQGAASRHACTRAHKCSGSIYIYICFAPDSCAHTPCVHACARKHSFKSLQTALLTHSCAHMRCVHGTALTCAGAHMVGLASRCACTAIAAVMWWRGMGRARRRRRAR
jgi:hypothetical protein